jgi:ribosomal-protein-serine acetyltransferase
MGSLPPDFFLKVDDEVVLKMLGIDQAAMIFSEVDANRDYLRRFLGWVDSTIHVRDTEQFIQRALSKSIQLESLTLGVWYKNMLVGLVGFHEIDFLNRSSSIGYWLSEKHQGKGVMARSVQTLVDYGINELRLHRIEIRCAVSNVKSQKIPLKMGFFYEATLKEACWVNGHFLDLHVYTLLSSKKG